MESTHSPKQALIRLLSIIGFFAFVALILWGLVQGARAFPSAFSSLASIAESINNYRPKPTFEVTSQKNIVNSGEEFAITWTDMGDGSYRFNVACEDTLLVKVRAAEGSLRDIRCSDTLDLPAEAHGLFATIEGGMQRFSEQRFSVTFIPNEGDEITVENSVTVLNATMPTFPVAIENPVTDEAEVKEDEDSEPESVVVTPAPLPPPTTPAPKPVTASQPATVILPSYPISNPTGTVDLEITYLGTGTVVNGIFVSKTSFDEDDRAAFRFQVKNVGTKTSNVWAYELELPDRSDYKGPEQAPLRPSEYAIFTVGFDILDKKDKSVTLEGSVSVTGDVNSKNNSFERTVKVVD